jgi:hypothetical protein
MFTKKKGANFQCDEINIPVFQTAQDVTEYCDEKKLMKNLMFKSNITYPSTEIFQFYESYLKKNGFETVSLKKLTRKNREWTILHTESAGKKRYSAHFKAFWQNIEKHQIWWLELESDISNIKNGNNETNSNGKQYVFINAKIFYPMPNIDEINISHFYPELFNNELEKNEKAKKSKRIKLSFEGYYTLGEVQLRFRIVKLPSAKENIPEGFEKNYDLKGKLYYDSKETEISEKDIDHLVVKKSDFNSGFDVVITLKDDFFKKNKKKLLGLKSKWLGLFKEKEMILAVLVHTPFEKEMILIINDSAKLKIIIEGMNKEKE